MSGLRHAFRKQGAGRKRISKACFRCRQQKIRCSEQQPCDQCSKRGLRCLFENKSDKILVSRDFIHNLERRAEENGHGMHRNTSIDAQDPSLPAVSATSALDTPSRPEISLSTDAPSNAPYEDQIIIDDNNTDQHRPLDHTRASTSDRGTPTAQLTNPFSSHAPRYIADNTGRPWYLGTSSNWAFNRQVLSMVNERLTSRPLPAEGTVDGGTYQLEWDDPSAPQEFDASSLPSMDYAIYLINAVKFHCGHILHLCDEASFMNKFRAIQEDPSGAVKSQRLFLVHFLVMLAFGKVFVARRNYTHKPPGIDLFVQAMRLLPNIVVLSTMPIDAIEALCCIALYLQFLDFRSSAYNYVGQALRLALNEGMHTSMQDNSLDAAFVQRCRSAWWTIYILDRQMSSLLGLPIAIRDEDISASLPMSLEVEQSSLALNLNVKLSRILSQILNTVYGTEGRLNRKFISSTKTALGDIATITDELTMSFPMLLAGMTSGISRLAAHLHLLHDHCIILATRPLLFSLLKMSLDHPDRVHALVASSGSARKLLQMCVDSAQHTLAVLQKLKEQDLLESFLPLDLNAGSAAGMVILLANIVDQSLIPNQLPWLDMVFATIDELTRQGSLAAVTRKKELINLQQLLKQLRVSDKQDDPIPPVQSDRRSFRTTRRNRTHEDPTLVTATTAQHPGSGTSSINHWGTSPVSQNTATNVSGITGGDDRSGRGVNLRLFSGHTIPSDNNMSTTVQTPGVSTTVTSTTNHHGMYDYMFDNDMWRNELTADHLIMVADSLDLDGIDWITTAG